MKEVDVVPHRILVVHTEHSSGSTLLLASLVNLLLGNSVIVENGKMRTYSKRLNASLGQVEPAKWWNGSGKKGLQSMQRRCPNQGSSDCWAVGKIQAFGELRARCHRSSI